MEMELPVCTHDQYARQQKHKKKICCKLKLFDLREIYWKLNSP